MSKKRQPTKKPASPKRELGVLRPLSIQGNIWIAILNIVLVIISYLVFVSYSDSLPSGLVKDITTGLVSASGIVAVVKSITIAASSLKSEDKKQLVSFWGRTGLTALVLISSIPLNGIIILWDYHVSQPCYGISHADSNKELIVLFAKFEQLDDSDPSGTWALSLEHEMSDLLRTQGIKPVKLPDDVKITPDDPQQQNECYGAILTIWGTEAKNVITVNYTNAVDSHVLPGTYRRGTDDPEQLNPDQGIVDIPTFTHYLEKGADTTYVM